MTIYANLDIKYYFAIYNIIKLEWYRRTADLNLDLIRRVRAVFIFAFTASRVAINQHVERTPHANFITLISTLTAKRTNKVIIAQVRANEQYRLGPILPARS